MTAEAAAHALSALGPAGLQLARDLVREGRLDEAEAVLEGGPPRHPGAAVAGRDRARLAQLRRRFGEAVGRWRMILAEDRTDAAAAQGLLRGLRSSHRLLEAQAIVEELIAAAPAAGWVELEAARLAGVREDHAKAVRHGHAALAATDSPADAFAELASAYRAQQDWRRAEAVLAILAAADPRAVEPLAELARTAQARGDLELARTRWSRVLERDGRHLKAGLALGRLHEEAGQVDEAEAVFRDLADLHPASPQPTYQLGRLALSSADPVTAKGWLAQALAIAPDDWAVRAAMVRVEAERGRFAAARRAARELTEELPDHLDALLLQAWVEERAGREDAALAVLQAATRRFEQGFMPALKLADHLHRHGDDARARATLEVAAERHPDCLPLELARIDAAFATGDVEAATRRADALHAAYPHHRDVLKRVARAETQAQRYRAARRIWARVTCHDRRVSGPPLNLERLDERPIPERSAEIRLFTRLRNEAARLPWLFDFYKSQGVDRFIVVDNGSTDGSRNYLLARPDTHLFLTTDPYAVYGGGMRWLNHLLNRHGSGHWCLTVDVDEVLAYPHAERVGLRALTDRLAASGAEGLLTFMLDMYAPDPLQEVRYAPGDDPFAICPCFDRAGYVTRPHPDFPFRQTVGGLVARYFYQGRQDGVHLHKVPLVRWQEGMHYTSSTHTLFPLRLAAETGVLLHFKYMADLIGRAEIESRRRQYWQGAKRYTMLRRRVAAEPALDFRCELTTRFESTAQLVGLGLMTSTPELDALASAATDRAAPRGWPALRSEEIAA